MKKMLSFDRLFGLALVSVVLGCASQRPGSSPTAQPVSQPALNAQIGLPPAQNTASRCAQNAEEIYREGRCKETGYAMYCKPQDGLAQLEIGSDAQDKAVYFDQTEGARRLNSLLKQCMSKAGS